MSTHVEALKSAFDSFLEENEKFENGNALQEMTKAAKERRKEITDTKNARKNAAVSQ